MMKCNEQYKNSESIKKKISEVTLSQLGFFTKDLNLYDLFEGMGKSEVGKEMDKMGGYLPKDIFIIEILPFNNGRKIRVSASSAEKQSRLSLIGDFL